METSESPKTAFEVFSTRKWNSLSQQDVEASSVEKSDLESELMESGGSISHNHSEPSWHPSDSDGSWW